jgi:hypothetical protein
VRENVSLVSIYSKVKSAVESKGCTSTAKSPSEEVKVSVNKVERSGGAQPVWTSNGLICRSSPSLVKFRKDF